MDPMENLSQHLVHNHNDMEDLINLGNANHTTASTGMNGTSSRSHGIFTIRFTQAWFDAVVPRETLSKIHLVDLAGSKRADFRLKEGANINKSLVILGSVISALAELSVGGRSTKKKTFIPYRDPVLTWLLKDSLGGNSVTTMIATISPTNVNYLETLNENVKVIRQLRAEVSRLRGLLEQADQVSRVEPSSSVKVEEELHQNEARVLELPKEWTSKCGETRSILQEETVALKKKGSGVLLGCQLPHLIGIDEDMLSGGIVLYYLKEGSTLIGSEEASCSQGIVLHGPGLLSEHCVLENRAETVTLIPRDGALCSTLLSGAGSFSPAYYLLIHTALLSRDNNCTQNQAAQGLATLVISPKLGGGTLLRVNQPTEAEEKLQSGLPSAFSLPLTGMSNSTETLSEAMLQNPGRMEEKLNQQEVEWQQVQENLNRRNRDIKRLSKENSRAPHQSIAERKATGLEMEETGNGQMEMQSAETAASIVPHSCLTSATIEKLINAVIPGKDPVPITSIQMDRDTLQDGISTRDGREQEGDLCHKSGPELMSEWPRRKAREEVWSGDASLQQTSVLGPGDGCGTKPEGNANKIKGAMADCYKERPDSGGSSLSSMSHLQSSRGTRSTSVLPQNSTHPQLDIKPLCSQAARCPLEKTIFEGLFGCTEMDESGGLQGFTTEVETAAASIQHSGWALWSAELLGWSRDQGAGHLLWSSASVLQYVRKEGVQHVGARWSSHVVSLVREGQYMSVVKDSKVFSLTLISTSLHNSQKIVALYWLNVVKCSQPEPRSALLVQAETGLFTLTADSGHLVMFHQLPLVQLKEVQIDLAGHSLRLMGSPEESTLGVYTHSQKPYQIP
ncbi:hypothetical protein KUCAC02_024629, partial [Chaenocephalus aceratus]